ncbi:MAG: hypothetical protein NC324_02605 [Bacteroides sp.]|nr:hypothetical protein [Bacteroides sp.]
MNPIGFKQATKTLQRPPTMQDSECQSLPVWSDGKQCISCWRPNFLERVRILFGGKVWLGVLSGRTQPPVYVSGRCVFTKTPANSKVKAVIVHVCERVIATAERIKQKASNE